MATSDQNRCHGICHVCSQYTVFFALYRFEGFAGIWSKLLAAAMPIIMGLVLAYLMNPVMLWLERCFKSFFPKDEKRKQAAKGFKSSCNHRLGYYSGSDYFAPHCGYCAFCHSKYIRTYEDTANDVAAFINMIKNGNFGDSKLLSSRAQVYRMQPTTLRIMPQKS